MSAATRRPYLGEDVHFHHWGECYAAKITRLLPEVELFVWFRVEPRYATGGFNAAHVENTWHYAH